LEWRVDASFDFVWAGAKPSFQESGLINTCREMCNPATGIEFPIEAI
jgi:hypothetical protein